MRGLTSHQYANALRKLADEITQRPDFKLGLSVTEFTAGIAASREELLDFAKNLHPLKKQYLGDYIVLTFGSGELKLRLEASRSKACRVIKPATEAVYECDPLLSMEEEAAL